MPPLQGSEPALGDNWPDENNGAEPMLGGGRRERFNRDLFSALLDLHNIETRRSAIEQVQTLGAGRYYGARLAAVLKPGARYFDPGRFWKTPYDHDQKLAAMDSMVRCDANLALGGLILALGNDDLNIQRAAIALIGQLADSNSESALLSILGDPRSEIRHAAIDALGRRWQQPQMLRLTNVHGTVVSEAARWLGEHGDSKVLVPLIAILRDRRFGDDWHLVLNALVQAIGQLGQRFQETSGDLAVTALRQILDQRETGPAVAQQAVVALYEIGTEDARAAAIVYHTNRLGRRLRLG